jgi:hypothetical protein
MIHVKQVSAQDPFEFEVTVQEASGQTRHFVTMSQSDYARLTREEVAKERCIEACFSFLLDHESKESILSRFDIRVISGYFPHFDSDFCQYL